MMIRRRSVLRLSRAAAAGTLAATVLPRKPRAETLAPLSEALEPVSPPANPPDGAFVTPDGVSHRLSEFQGHGMVVNMWATWCAPCVAEMPSLEKLSRALAPHDIAVLPLSSDRGGAPVVQAWFKAHDITALPVLIDPRGALADAFGARGIPPTVGIAKSGKVGARVQGAADWAAPGAAALIRKLTGG